MLGLMVMSYSIPLHLTEITEVVRLGVPWWSGLMVSVCGVACFIQISDETRGMFKLMLFSNVVFVSVLTVCLSPGCVCVHVCVFPVHHSRSGRYHLGQTLHHEDCESIEDTYTHANRQCVYMHDCSGGQSTTCAGYGIGVVEVMMHLK